MMHNPLETRCPAREWAAYRCLQSFGENQLTAISGDTAEPARADAHHNMPSLRWKIGQRAPVAAVDARADTAPQSGQAAVAASSRATISNLSASISMHTMASPRGASVIPRPMTAIPWRFTVLGLCKLHQH
jgi:hypothetical protein